MTQLQRIADCHGRWSDPPADPKCNKCRSRPAPCRAPGSLARLLPCPISWRPIPSSLVPGPFLLRCSKFLGRGYGWPMHENSASSRELLRDDTAHFSTQLRDRNTQPVHALVSLARDGDDRPRLDHVRPRDFQRVRTSVQRQSAHPERAHSFSVAVVVGASCVRSTRVAIKEHTRNERVGTGNGRLSSICEERDRVTTYVGREKRWGGARVPQCSAHCRQSAPSDDHPREPCLPISSMRDSQLSQSWRPLPRSPSLRLLTSLTMRWPGSCCCTGVTRIALPPPPHKVAHRSLMHLGPLRPHCMPGGSMVRHR